MWALIVLLLPLAILLYAVASRALSRSPPGPIGIPGLGLLPLTMWRAATNPRYRFFLFLQELRRKYGDVASFKLGTQEFVLISGYETMREAFVTNTDTFMARANTNFHKYLMKDSGIFGTEGAVWQEHRRFAMRALKEFGFGRIDSEVQIQDEAAQVVAFLKEKDGQKVDVKVILTKSVANVVTRYLFSSFNSYDDPDFIEFIQQLGGINHTNIVGILTAFYRELSVETAMSISPGNRTSFEAVTWIEDRCRRKVKEIRSRYNGTDEPSNYVEAFLQEQKRRGHDVGTFTDFQLVKTIWDIYVAGVDTTSNSLRWCLLYAALNPELQDRCHEEIMAKIGKRQVTLKDKKELHYCQAFLDEAQRISTLVPTSVDHRAQEDTEFRGYNISANAMIFVNLYGLHHDEKHFPEPNRFNPDRFLTPQGQYKPSEFLHQFGIGKRSCLGEILARMELFLFFVTFMQHFRFQADNWSPEREEQILLGTEGIIHAPLDHLLLVTNRDDVQD